MTGEMKDSSVGVVVAVLELVASERPQLLDFQLDMLLHSPMRFAAHDLASDFGVPLEKVGVTIYQACHHLDRLEKRRGQWRDPRSVIPSSNLAALHHVCKARLRRVSRRRRLEAILRRLQEAHRLARSRAWIEAFIDPSSPGRKGSPIVPAPPTSTENE